MPDGAVQLIEGMLLLAAGAGQLPQQLRNVRCGSVRVLDGSPGDVIETGQRGMVGSHADPTVREPALSRRTG